jgi:hypothetical protein
MRSGPTICKGLFCLVVLLLLSSCGLPVSVSGLKPEYPKKPTAVSGGFAFYEVDSLQPTFRWESFPRPQDLRNDKDGLVAQIHNVIYDLKIWREEDYYSGKIAYRREGLPAPLHEIEEPLEPSTKYFWTIRARFEVGGRIRVTEWGVIRLGSRSPILPNPFYYRFKTPSE